MIPVRVLAVDDQPVFLTVIRALVTSTPGFVLVREARSGREAIDAARTLRPDLVLLDLRLPDVDGIETARRIAGSGSRAVIVLISSHDLEEVRELAMESGVADVVLKERLRPALLRRLWAVYGERRWTLGRRR